MQNAREGAWAAGGTFSWARELGWVKRTKKPCRTYRIYRNNAAAHRTLVPSLPGTHTDQRICVDIRILTCGE